MTAGELLASLLRTGVSVTRDGDDLVLDGPEAQLEGPLVAACSRRKHALLALLASGFRYLPVSHAQERLWLLAQWSTGAGHLVQTAMRSRGAIDASRLSQSLDALALRQESLRTSFVSFDGVPVQRVTAGSIHVPLCTLAHGDAAIEQLAAAELERPFALDEAPLMRALLVRDRDGDALVVTMHHLIIDAWSIDLMLAELARLYDLFTRELCDSLPPLRMHYGDFALSERWPRADDGGALAFWREHLRDAPTMSLPSDTYGVTASQRGARCEVTPDAAERAIVATLAQAAGVTPFVVWLTAWHVVIGRFTGGHDLIVGIPAVRRPHPDLEPVIGLFLETLPVRCDARDDPPFAERARRLRDGLIAALRHPSVPFQRIVQELRPVRGGARTPLYRVACAAQRVPRPPQPDLTLELCAIDGLEVMADAELTLYVADEMRGSRLVIEYDRALFSPASIHNLLDELRAVLRAAAGDRAAPSTLVQRHRSEMLRMWNPTVAPHDDPARIEQLVAQQAARTPDATALVACNGQLSYGALEQRANSLAHSLREIGVVAETRVAVCMARTSDLVVSLLAILKAGGAYLPIDVHTPPTRIADVCARAGVALVLTARACTTQFPDGLMRRCVDELLEEGARPASPQLAVGGPQSLAYVLYTSGSTGAPKGVAVEHRSVVNCLRSFAQALPLRGDDRWLAITNLTFDIAALELFLPLIVGARLQLASDMERADPQRLADVVEATRITHAQATPTLWRALVETGWRGDASLTLLSGGELLSPRLATELRAGGSTLWNVYGPTETTIWSTATPIAGQSLVVPLGRPIANTQTHIVDEKLREAPLDGVGELTIGGRGLARGYVGDAAATAARFVPDPFGAAGTRLYCTGDLARLTVDGELIFLGRRDTQVKVRGHRIELAEIEAALDRHPRVQASAVVAVKEPVGQWRLAAFIVTRGEVVSAELRRWLRESLPEYMVPSAWQTLAALPLLPSGKLDRAQLAASAKQRAQPLPSSASTTLTATETTLAALWAEVLALPQVAPDHDFFDLGGHSLLAMRILSRVRTVFGVELQLKALFEAPTVRELGRMIDHEAGPARPSNEDDDALLLALLDEIEQISPAEAATALRASEIDGLD